MAKSPSRDRDRQPKGGSPPHSLGPPSVEQHVTRIPPHMLVLITTTAGMAMLASALSWPGQVTADVWIWLALCLIGERLWIRMPLGQATVSMASAIQFAALLVLPRGHAMMVGALSVILAELIFMRKPLIRVIFNASQTTLTIGATAWAMAFLGNALHAAGAVPLVTQLSSFVVGATVYFVVNTGAVSLAVAFSERISALQAWRSNFGTRHELLSNGALFSLGAMLASLHALSGAAATVLVVLPLLLAYEGYQHHVRTRIQAALKPERQAA